jgi:hypothetical protein
MGQLDLTPLPDATLVLVRHGEIILLLGSCVCLRNSICLGRLGKPFIHFLFVGEQLLDARALLHGEEIKVRLLL